MRGENKEGGNTYVVRSNSIDLFNGVTEGHSFVRDKLDEVVRSALSCEQFKLLVDCSRPQGDHSNSDLSAVVRFRHKTVSKITYNNCARRIEP